jgi:hypothetical protein
VEEGRSFAGAANSFLLFENGAISAFPADFGLFAAHRRTCQHPSYRQLQLTLGMKHSAAWYGKQAGECEYRRLNPATALIFMFSSMPSPFRFSG